MADVFQRLRGIVGDLFQIGNAEDGLNLKKNGTVLESRNTDDSDFALHRAAHIPTSGATVNDIVDLLNLRGRPADMAFSFDGASPPAPGTNTGQFGICHTTGGSYTETQVVYDDAASLILMPTAVSSVITTRTGGVGGNLNLVGNGLFVNESGTLVLKDSGGATSGERQVLVTYDYTDSTVSSSAQVPEDAYVTRVTNIVTTAFDGTSPTLEVKVDGTSDEVVLETTDSRLKRARQYQSIETHLITSSTEGPVTLTVVPSGSTVGEGYVLLEYDMPLT